MNAEYIDFIGFYRNVYAEGYCEHLIKEFDRLEESGVGSNRQKSENASKHVKNDYQIMINLRNHNLKDFRGKESCDLFFEGLQKCYDHYCNEYSILRDSSIRATVMKMQKTGPGGGYHVWHGEQGPGASHNRVLVYMLYLNSLKDNDGGETEFLYQRKRINPQENLMLFWPASYTHAHRGNLILNNVYKYIVTGWFYYD